MSHRAERLGRLFAEAYVVTVEHVLEEVRSGTETLTSEEAADAIRRLRRLYKVADGEAERARIGRAIYGVRAGTRAQRSSSRSSSPTRTR